MTIELTEENQKRISGCIAHIAKLRKILDGLEAFADIRDKEDAGDWVVVSQTADPVRRCLGDVIDEIDEAIDPGDTGDM